MVASLTVVNQRTCNVDVIKLKHFRFTGHLCAEFFGHRWIPRIRASDADLWFFFFDLPLNKGLSKQWWCWRFKTPSCPLWRHCNVHSYLQLHWIIWEIVCVWKQQCLKCTEVLLSKDAWYFSHHIQYIPRNMHTVFALLCFVVAIHWLILPYPSDLLHWHCGNLTIAPVPAKQPWWIWINTSCEFIMNDCITTTKQSTTKPCAYFLGYTVRHNIDATLLSNNSTRGIATYERHLWQRCIHLLVRLHSLYSPRDSKYSSGAGLC